ncbi:MAG: hypothetical protein QOJ02_1860 [Acidobacteriota bacterium]|jgi:hypothetical protein|nr:hypothetical protein [Acidobacteriota bacterium]
MIVSQRFTTRQIIVIKKLRLTFLMDKCGNSDNKGFQKGIVDSFLLLVHDYCRFDHKMNLFDHKVIPIRP